MEINLFLSSHRTACLFSNSFVFYLEVQQSTPLQCVWPAGAAPLHTPSLLSYHLSNTALYTQQEVQRKNVALIKW